MNRYEIVYPSYLVQDTYSMGTPGKEFITNVRKKHKGVWYLIPVVTRFFGNVSSVEVGREIVRLLDVAQNVYDKYIITGAVYAEHPWITIDRVDPDQRNRRGMDSVLNINTITL